MVIGDGFLAHSSRLDRAGYQHYRSHEETLGQLISHDDTMVLEKIIPVEKLKTYNENNTELIRKRVKELAKAHPSLAPSLGRYVQWEERESEILETETIPAVWLLQRN